MAKIELNIDASFFNEAYIPYLNRDERWQVFYGGSGSGKSNFIASNLILRLLEKKQNLLVVRQTFATHRDSTFAEIKATIEKMSLLDTVKISKTTLDIEFHNGSKIIFKGADDENKLLSIQGITLCWIEEATEISKEILDQLNLRLRGGRYKKHFFLSFNPISALHWLKAEFFDNPRNDSFVCHTTYKDNRFLEAEYIDNLLEMKERNPLKYAVYALGEWGTTGKVVYTEWKELDFEINEIIKATPSVKSALGMDFGYMTDPTTLIVTLVDLENRKLYIVDEMYEKGLLNNEIAQRIYEKGYSKEKIIADSAEKKSIDEIASYGINRIEPARKGSGSIMQGIQFIQQFEIFVHPRCTHTIDELENYSFKKDRATGQYLNQPIDDYNHVLDALRYALEPYSGALKKKIKTMSKKIFGL